MISLVCTTGTKGHERSEEQLVRKKIMNTAFKLMDSAFKLSNSAFKLMDFAGVAL